MAKNINQSLTHPDNSRDNTYPLLEVGDHLELNERIEYLLIDMVLLAPPSPECQWL
jgi:hypothetical protein